MALALDEYDIYNESAFPHEWNYGLAEFPLPKQLSVGGIPREGDFEFEYSERAYPLVRPLRPPKRKRPNHRSPRLWMRRIGTVPVDARLPRPRPDQRVPILTTGDEPAKFPPPRPPIQKTWHYVWQTKKVLACTGNGCPLCWP